MEEKFPLTEAQKAAQLQWESKKMTTQQNYNVIIFLDEKKFNFDGPDGFRFYWRDLRHPAQQAVWRQQGGGSIMFCWAINWEGKSELAILNCRQTSFHYVYTIGEFLIPFAHLKYGT